MRSMLNLGGLGRAPQEIFKNRCCQIAMMTHVVHESFKNNISNNTLVLGDLDNIKISQY